MFKKKSSLKIAARTKPNINQQQQQKHLVMSCLGKILCKQKFQNASWLSQKRAVQMKRLIISLNWTNKACHLSNISKSGVLWIYIYLHTYVYTHMTRVFLEVEKLTLNVTGKNKHKKLLVNFSFFKKRKMEMDFFLPETNIL